MLIAWIVLAVGVVLIGLTALYVAAEFALVTVDRTEVDSAVAGGDTTLVRLSRSLKHLSTQLSGAQVGITVTTLALGYVMEPSLAAILAGPLRSAGLSTVAATTVSVAIALAVATVLSMVFGELVPKNIAIARPLATARVVSGINAATTTAAAPLIWALNGTANATLRLMGVQPTEELASARTIDELVSLVRRSGVHGRIQSDSARLIARTLRFSAKSADDVMTPRVDVITVRSDQFASDVIDAAVACGRSRFPVVAGDIDNVVGVVHVKRAVAVPAADRAAVPVRSLMTVLPRVPGTVPLDELLPLLRGRGLQMAQVLDEYGGTAGIVTLEDLVEELIGEIADEHDAEPPAWRRLPDGVLRVAGSLRPDEIAELTGIRLPDPTEYDTVAGLITERLGRLPAAGDRIEVRAAIQPEARLGAEAGGEPVEVDTTTDIARLRTVALRVAAVEGHRIATVDLSAGADAVPGEDWP